ncbi:MAG: leucine-rich repeat domain-containing protein, partial [Phoenicibacter congonensis]|nr:leucine-rich repeat domain-containing protein [Phoenicibacter congonensis]
MKIIRKWGTEMKLRNMLWLLLSLLLVIAPITAFASDDGDSTGGTTTEGSESTQESEASDWTPEDFTYGEWKIGEAEKISPADDPENYLTVTVWVVTGLSDSGKEKLKTRSDLVIPAKDPDGRKVQGVGEQAFYENSAVQSVTFPENVTAKVRTSDFNRGYCWKTSEDDGVPEERGDFFIGKQAFGCDSLSKVTIPEGTLYVGQAAFVTNSFESITLPSSLMLVDERAFCSIWYRELTELKFPETTTFPLNVRYDG